MTLENTGLLVAILAGALFLKKDNKTAIIALGCYFLAYNALASLVFIDGLFAYANDYPFTDKTTYYTVFWALSLGLFGSAALTDLYVIHVIGRLKESAFTKKLIVCCLAFIFVNVVGWILYMLELYRYNLEFIYINSQLYTSLCTAVYAYILLTTVNQARRERVRGSSVDTGPHVFRRHIPKVSIRQTEARN